MPTLNWIGKEKVVNHHLDVPYLTLDRQYSYDENGRHENDNGSENMIIHGDNLTALKSLLPRYEGRIKCIYIDPPYNTGNEKWVYNDNVNSPIIKKWIGEVVGAEGEDLSRHDKWLCMMYPRLRLLHKLLANDGVIFISIDDNEQANLKLMCDEVFGKQNFVANLFWKKRTAKSDVPYGISQDGEMIVCYSKSEKFKAAIKGKERKYYCTPDFPNREWRIHDLTKQTTAEERPNSYFTIVNPKNNKEYPANPNATWRITIDTFDKYYQENRIVFPDDYDFLKISKPVLRYWKDDDIKKAGVDFGLSAVSSYLPSDIVKMTQDGTKEITAIFGSKKFNFPKPSALIKYLIDVSTILDKNAIILDSFAGSGTTAHAVLDMNKADGGNRKFILIEMGDYADNITAERVKRVIDGYGDGKKAVDGTGGNFSFYELGQPILKGDLLNEDVDTQKIREYIFYTETKQIPTSKDDEQYFLGEYESTAYYFVYEKNAVTSLNRDFLHTLKTKSERYVIYADKCTLSDEQLEQWHITFRKIPRDITKI